MLKNKSVSFKSPKEKYNFGSSYVLIGSSSKQFQVPYDDTIDYAEFEDESLAGQSLTAVLVRNGTNLQDLLELNETIALEIGKIIEINLALIISKNFKNYILKTLAFWILTLQI